MARQNVGTPKFYIDYIQYWHAKGLVDGIGPYEEDASSDHANGIDDEKDVLKGGSAYKPQLIGLDPSNYMEVDRLPYSSNDIYYIYTACILNERVYLPSSGNVWSGFLNHNFADIGIEYKGIDLFKSLGFFSNENAGYRPDLAQNDTRASFSFISNTNGVKTNIVNFDHGQTIEFNGFSIAQSLSPMGVNGFYNEIHEESGELYGAGFDQIRSILLAPVGSNIEFKVINGSFNLGGVYEMPNSADLNLTMSREYDGVQNQTTIGGSTLRNVRYSGPSNWRVDLPAWHLTRKMLDNHQMPSSSRGRRVWNLNFSYLDGDDLLALNESLSVNNPTDSWSNDNSGYSSSDFGVDAEPTDTRDFVSNIESDSSFYGMVIHKTMGGALPFIFQPDSNNNSPDQFAICEIDRFKVKQVAHKVYDIKLKIREVW